MRFYGFDLSNISLDASTATVASGAFFLFVIFAFVTTMIMFWHWRRYGFGMKGVILAEVVYLTGLAVLLGGSFYELQFLN